MKHKYTSLILTAIIISLISLSPAVGLAKEKDGNGKSKRNESQKSEMTKIKSASFGSSSKEFDKSDDDEHENGLRNTFSQFRSWFDGRFNNAYGATSVRNNSLTTTSKVANQTPVITGLKAPTLLAVGQTGTWTVKAYDPNNGSLEYAVDWGDTAMMKTNNFAQSVITQTNTFTHSYSVAGNYTVTFTVTNDAGKSAKTTTTVHVGPSSTVTPPVLSNVMATSTHQRNGTVSWTTDKKSSSLVWYSTVSPVNTLNAPNISRSALVTNHKINIDGLQPSTKYFVVVGSRDKDGSVGISSETSFTTAAKPIPTNKPPVITGIAGTTTITVGQTGTWTVQAHDPENGSLSYDVNWGDIMASSLVKSTLVQISQTSTFTHVYANPGIYTAVFTVTDDAGNAVSSSIMINVISN